MRVPLAGAVHSSQSDAPHELQTNFGARSGWLGHAAPGTCGAAFAAPAWCACGGVSARKNPCGKGSSGAACGVRVGACGDDGAPATPTAAGAAGPAGSSPPQTTPTRGAPPAALDFW